MADATTIVQGTWCHIEIPAADRERAKQFYGEVFGWKFQDVPLGDSTYTLYTTPEGIGGGIWDPPPGIPRQMINYISVDEIEPVVESAETNGGQVVLPKHEVPGIGWFSLVADPDGNLFGVWKEGEKP